MDAQTGADFQNYQVFIQVASPYLLSVSPVYLYLIHIVHS